MSGQANVGCKHKPKCEITHQWNVDKHRDQREERNTKRNYVYAENLKTLTAATLMLLASDSFAIVEVHSFRGKHKAKPRINNISLR
jgi:hypothetical protein